MLKIIERLTCTKVSALNTLKIRGRAAVVASVRHRVYFPSKGAQISIVLFETPVRNEFADATAVSYWSMCCADMRTCNLWARF